MSRFEFPELEGWKTVSQIADMLGISRQAVHKMLPTDALDEDSVRQIGSGLKPVYLVRNSAVQSLIKKRSGNKQ